MYKGDVNLLDEIAEQDFDGIASAGGWCSTNTFSLSDHLGNKGDWCTLSVECIKICG